MANNTIFKGRVLITVSDKKGSLIKSYAPNAVIVDASRILLAQLIPSSLSTPINVIPKSGRPDVVVSDSGPSSANSIAYLRLGYTTEDSVPEGASSSSTDISMHSSDITTVKLSEVSVSSNSLTFSASIVVDSSNASRKYYEAALYTAGSGNESIPDSPNTSTMLMFAHQVHSLVSAPSGSTITYYWTIAIPE